MTGEEKAKKNHSLSQHTKWITKSLMNEKYMNTSIRPA